MRSVWRTAPGNPEGSGRRDVPPLASGVAVDADSMAYGTYGWLSRQPWHPIAARGTADKAVARNFIPATLSLYQEQARASILSNRRVKKVAPATLRLLASTACLLLSVVSFGRAARAAGDPEVTGAACTLAEREDAERAFSDALAHYRGCAAAGSGTARARALQRIAWLEARSEGGGFAPLARLEEVRRDPVLSRDPVAVERLASDAETFPAGRVRTEARMVVADAWMGSLQRPGDALVELRRVARDPATDPLTASLAERLIVEELTNVGSPADAASEAVAHADLLDAGFVARVRRLARRRWLLACAQACIAAFAGFAVTAVARARRRQGMREALQAVRDFAPMAVAFALFLGVAGGALASRYESGNARPFAFLGAAVLPLLLVARSWNAVGSPHTGPRVGRAVLCGVAVVAAAFALLATTTPDYLDGFGL